MAMQSNKNQTRVTVSNTLFRYSHVTFINIMASQFTSTRLIAQQPPANNNTENNKALHYCPFMKEIQWRGKSIDITMSSWVSYLVLCSSLYHCSISLWSETVNTSEFEIGFVVQGLGSVSTHWLNGCTAGATRCAGECDETGDVGDNVSGFIPEMGKPVSFSQYQALLDQ